LQNKNFYLTILDMHAEESQPFSGAIIMLFVLAVFIVAGGVYGYLYYTGKVSIPFSGESAAGSAPDDGSADTANSVDNGYDPTTAEGDINDDGKVDLMDMQYIKDHAGCNQDDECWSKMIDKTITGHNPIYTSDLDLNQDGMIDESDITVK
jgi:hypothetical protein